MTTTGQTLIKTQKAIMKADGFYVVATFPTNWLSDSQSNEVKDKEAFNNWDVVQALKDTTQAWMDLKQHGM